MEFDEFINFENSVDVEGPIFGENSDQISEELAKEIEADSIGLNLQLESSGEEGSESEGEATDEVAPACSYSEVQRALMDVLGYVSANQPELCNTVFSLQSRIESEWLQKRIGALKQSSITDCNA